MLINRPIIYSFDTLCRIIRDAKGQGKRICLTHGAFDLFHYSHLDLLQKSASVCDFLIVGVDSDSSVSKYKSYHRPIIPEEQRLKIVSGLKCVDAVFVKEIGLNSEDHIDLYRALIPDIVTIGNKFAAEDRIGYDSAQSGAALIKIDTWQEPKTSTIIDSIIKKYSQFYYNSRGEDIFQKPQNT